MMRGNPSANVVIVHADDLHEFVAEERSTSEQLKLPLAERLRRRHYTARELFLIDLAAVLILALVAILLPSQPARATGGIWMVLAWVAGVLSGVGVLLRRRYPLAVVWVILPFVLIVLGLRAHQPAPFYLVLVLYSAVKVMSRGRALAMTLFICAAAVIAVLIGGGEQVANGAIGGVAVLIVGWLAGDNAKASRVYEAQRAERVRERRAALEAEQAERVERAVADERVKIARELHDIVAHGMSVIAVRSAVARMVLDAQPEEAREALEIIETTSRRSLREMRMLVGVLRDDNRPAAELTPAPTVADVKRLIEDVRSAGVEVEMEVAGTVPELPAAVELSVYRILQEALTNVVRHAGPTCAHVHVTFGAGAVDLDILDDGPPTRPRRPPTGEPRSPAARAGGGHGLIGMRERAAMFGGDVTAGPAGSGFRVKVHLPLADAKGGDGNWAEASAKAAAAKRAASAAPDDAESDCASALGVAVPSAERLGAESVGADRAAAAVGRARE
jgi:signal transduction histidine kinase